MIPHGLLLLLWTLGMLWMLGMLWTLGMLSQNPLGCSLRHLQQAASWRHDAQQALHDCACGDWTVIGLAQALDWDNEQLRVMWSSNAWAQKVMLTWRNVMLTWQSVQPMAHGPWLVLTAPGCR